MEQNAKGQFLQAASQQFRMALAHITPAERPSIYALSCWYFTEEDDLRFPTLVLGYNTTEQVQTQRFRASSEAEAKWNFAFWLQNELAIIGGQADELLAAWFRATPFYYSATDKEAATNDATPTARLLQQGEQFNQQFIEVAIELIQQLFTEGTIEHTFGHNIPVLLHELEYYDQPITWTKQANPPGLADEFLQVYSAGML